MTIMVMTLYRRKKEGQNKREGPGPVGSSKRQRVNENGRAARDDQTAQAGRRRVRRGDGVTAALKKIFGLTGGRGEQRRESGLIERGTFFQGMNSLGVHRLVERVYPARAKERLYHVPEPRTSHDSTDPEESELGNDQQENTNTTSANERAQARSSHVSAAADTYPPATGQLPEDMNLMTLRPGRAREEGFHSIAVPTHLLLPSPPVSRSQAQTSSAIPQRIPHPHKLLSGEPLSPDPNVVLHLPHPGSMLLASTVKESPRRASVTSLHVRFSKPTPTPNRILVSDVASPFSEESNDSTNPNYRISRPDPSLNALARRKEALISRVYSSSKAPRRDSAPANAYTPPLVPLPPATVVNTPTTAPAGVYWVSSSIPISFTIPPHPARHFCPPLCPILPRDLRLFQPGIASRPVTSPVPDRKSSGATSYCLRSYVEQSPSSDEDSEEDNQSPSAVTEMMPDASRSSRRPPCTNCFHYLDYKIHVPAYSGHAADPGSSILVTTPHHIRYYDLSVSDIYLWSADMKGLGMGDMKAVVD
ncbi:hypothetical protein CONPUDRAFT_72117 [Coniophora puteana RWD-64-598 SS2]|uniref:Uncharacterized protein n=1 Tax=Coniophora puteana (strain RWD-64-598) TaxID=741705 RepID=A0A5M3MRA1_CONPW|nr:uncharacterized protein CONPUDRAFT_72117 [Coniophora puteana RWD-64-598 SS2]EIW81703.1 hypothetical protein CONPUDRAFT_72117 [Coniophora puteana RWD-64-598 SS2]